MKRIALFAGAILAFGLAAPSSAQEGGFGDGFQSFSLTAVAGGQRVIGDSIAEQPPGTIQSGIPEAEARMTKSTGHALASVAWPSALAGNAGSLLFLLGPYPCAPALPNLFPGQPQPPPNCSPVAVPPEVMAQYRYLNTPVRAEAIYPVKPTENNSVPGASMAARATDVDVAADAIIGGVLATEIERIGTARATSVVRLTGASSAVADAQSIVSDISFVDGAVTIGSVTSVAHGETNGETARSSGATTVNDMKVGGIPVTVDGAGVHVAGQNADAVGPAAQVVNEILAGAGMTMFVTRPTQTLNGATTTFDAGSLIVEWFPPGAPGGIVFEFGAAHVTASATLPFQADFELPPIDLPSVSATGGALSEFGSAASGLPSLSASGSEGPTLSFEPVAAPTDLPGGISGWWILWGLAAALALAAALRRLPDRVLHAAAATCETGEMHE